MATNVHDLLEANACDSSQDVCMIGKCELCLTSNLSLSDFDVENNINIIFELATGRQKYCENQPKFFFWSGYREMEFYYINPF